MACVRRSFLLFFLIIACSYAQQKAAFRDDYTYLAQSESFYKLHPKPKTWNESVAVCASEGATLYYPENEKEAWAVSEYWIAKEYSYSSHVGISSLNDANVFRTLDGRPLEQVHHEWVANQPTNSKTRQCVEIRSPDRLLNSIRCTTTLPFICKKTLSSLRNSQCNTQSPGYKYSEALGKCYKFHLKPSSWQDAYVTCNSENSYLAVANSEKEAKHLVQITTDAPKDAVGGNHSRGHVHLGFFKVNDWWLTIRGTRLADSGYTHWSYGKPNTSKDSHETCGGMFYTGQLNDINCNVNCFFICEHDLEQC